MIRNAMRPMEAVPYNPTLHYKEIVAWSKRRKQVVPPPEMLPKLGRIVPGLAVIFVYRTDSTLGFLENMLSNPEAKKGAISQALDLCVLGIQRDAIANGIKVLISTSFLEVVWERAKRLGFSVREDNYKFIYKGLV